MLLLQNIEELVGDALALSKVGHGRALRDFSGAIPAPVSCFGARHSVHLCDLINTKKEVGTRLTIMLRGPGNVVGRCLKPLSTSAKRGEHSLAVFERPA